MHLANGTEVSVTVFMGTFLGFCFRLSLAFCQPLGVGRTGACVCLAHTLFRVPSSGCLLTVHVCIDQERWSLPHPCPM